MDKEQYYQAAEPTLWQGRAENENKQRVYENVKCLNAQNIFTTHFSGAVVIIGFCSDKGVLRNQGRAGAAKGPDVIRQQLAKQAYHPSKTKTEHDIYDFGNVISTDADLETQQLALGEFIAHIRKNNGRPLVLGGGHETAWGHYQGLVPEHSQNDFAILNFDAHFDMRPLLEGKLGSSGTPFLQVLQHRQAHKQPFHYYCLGIKHQSNTPALFHTAHNAKVQYLTCDDIYAKSDILLPWVDNIINQHSKIYVTICLDVFSSAVAPGVSASAPYGLMPWHVLPAIKKLAQSQKIASFDIVEYAPIYDIDQSTAKLASTLALEILQS